MLSTLWIFTT